MSYIAITIIAFCISLIFGKSKDQFGITQLYSSAKNGLDYTPNWDIERTISDMRVDRDSTDDACYVRGAARTMIMKDGIMDMSGQSPRYYCYLDHTNVELTVYAQRGTEEGDKPYQGFQFIARSRHKDYKEDKCAARGYYFRYWNSGRACFQKEYIHGPYDDCMIYAKNKCNYDVPEIQLDQWYGIKFVIRNVGEIVHLEAYVDYTEGKNGGDWQLLHSFEDDGNWDAWKIDECMIDCGYELGEKWLTWGNSVVIRGDQQFNYKYKWMTVREIEGDLFGDSPSGVEGSGAGTDEVVVTLGQRSSKYYIGVTADGGSAKIMAVRLKGRGQLEWEDGIENRPWWKFREYKPYLEPITFQIETLRGTAEVEFDTILAGQQQTAYITQKYTEDEGNDSNVGVILGILSAVLIVIAICIVGAYCMRHKYRNKGDVTFDHGDNNKDVTITTDGPTDVTTTKPDDVEPEEIVFDA